MNPAINVNGQHETHPDAETLSAFTEQALNVKDRGEVLAHLAVCSRCRQVVALARESAGAEVAAARHVAVRPRVWWRSWGLALVPVAAVAATAVIAFYVHEQAVERTSEVAKLEQQQASEKTETPPQDSSQPPPQAAPPVPASPVEAQPKPQAPANSGSPARSRETEPPGDAPRKSAAVPVETAAAPSAASPAESVGGPLLSRDGPVETPGFERHGMAFARAAAPADDETQSEAAMVHEERKKQAEEAADDRHQYAAKAPAPNGLHDSEVDKTRIDKAEIDNAGSAPAESRPAASSEQVEVDAQQLEPQPVSDVNSGELKSLKLSGFSGALMLRPIHLPSGLRAISIASSDHCMLAIDKKGALFFSDDSGFTWEKVKRQWTGRAILVRRRTADDATPPAAAATGSAGNTSASDALSHPETVFELANDRNELWLSADGRIWAAK